MIGAIEQHELQVSRFLKEKPGLGLYAEASHRSPGSRNAPWVSPHAPRETLKGCIRCASKGDGCGTPLGCGQHVCGTVTQGGAASPPLTLGFGVKPLRG